MIIGITGNSGAGKTTVSILLAEKLNAKLIDADMIVKEEQKIGKQYYKKIVEAFGGEILLKNHEINRKKLANIIYNNLEKRNVINNITMEYIVPIIIEQAKSTEEENVEFFLSLVDRVDVCVPREELPEAGRNDLTVSAVFKIELEKLFGDADVRLELCNLQR